MPRVTMFMKGRQVSDEALEVIGSNIRILVVRAFCTDDHPISQTDIDWIPMILNPTAFASSLSIDIEAIGYTARKEKLLDQVVLSELKEGICDAFDKYMPKIDRTKPLIWIKFFDPDGKHF